MVNIYSLSGSSLSFLWDVYGSISLSRENMEGDYEEKLCDNPFFGNVFLESYFEFKCLMRKMIPLSTRCYYSRHIYGKNSYIYSKKLRKRWLTQAILTSMLHFSSLLLLNTFSFYRFFLSLLTTHLTLLVYFCRFLVLSYFPPINYPCTYYYAVQFLLVYFSLSSDRCFIHSPINN